MIMGKKRIAIKLTIEEMREIAKSRGGECLSDEYVDNKTKLRWKCSEGHIWEATPNDVKSDRWCRICAYRNISNVLRADIKEFQGLARERGGELISDKYVDSKTKLLWKCSKGHTWEATPVMVKSGTWCPYCAGIVKGTMEEMREIAESRGGECLSDEYVNSESKLQWRCSEGHTWESTPHMIKIGQWCPYCASGLGERICREFFVQFFNREFPKTRPKWLINADGNRMELDGYCKDLWLAFEHHGSQHYRVTRRYTKTEKSLQKRQRDDELKKKLCQKNGIVLIEVPEIPTLLPLSELQSYVIGKLKKEGVKLPYGYKERNINLNNAYRTRRTEIFLKEVRKLAKKNGGECLSKVYKSSTTKIPWKCSNGHTWEATPHNVRNGSWCPYCGGNVKLTIEEMRKIAKSRGGECLSTEYVNKNTKLLWKCSEGHTWEAIPDNVKRGTWCPTCFERKRGKSLKLTIEEMQKIAESHGGECLSAEYMDSKTKLLWKCTKGHTWEARPANVKNGSWCPYCAGKARRTIEEMRKIAENRGGECLSVEYVNTNIKLLWKCSKGHTWEATPNNVKYNDSWCPFCSGKEMRGIS